MKIRVLRNYDHRLKPAVIQAFRAGTVVNVPRDTAEALIAAGAAQALSKPKQKDADHGRTLDLQ